MIPLTPNHGYQTEYTAYLRHMLAGSYSLEDFIHYANIAANDPDWLLEIIASK